MNPPTDIVLVPRLIEQMALACPDRAAIVEAGRTVSYRALQGRANQIARYLRSCGVGPGDRVGVMLARSAGYAAAALGVLRAGGCYVPLDPGYPAARLEFMVADSGVKLVLAGEGGQIGMAKAVGLESAEITRLGESALGDDGDAGWSEDAPAYVIYTSGTTGRPKGVELTHGNLNHLIEWHTRAFGVSSRDRGVMLANVGFDASVWELWPALAAGAAVLVPSDEIIRDPAALRDWIVWHEVTIAFLPTLVAEALLALEWPAGPEKPCALRWMLTGGDTLRQTPRVGLPFKLVNNYGPAECTVVATSGEVPAGTGSASGTGQLPSIGRPIAGVRVYLLDGELREVAPGKAGEICIGGRGVGLGYLNQPELTAEKFVRWQGRGKAERVYRTGDLGRWDADGSLKFLGRADDQVQIRGYRVERGEVEAALQGLDSIQTAAVVSREFGVGDVRLTAYVVPAHGAALSRHELRRQLRARLPEYMVPAEFVRLDALPVSANGKIDRDGMPEPSDANRITTPLAEESPVEAELMAILKKLLSIEQIDRDDNFFLLGGHSFIAAQVIARVRSRFGVELSLRAVFDHPTPMAMAAEIEQRIVARLGGSL